MFSSAFVSILELFLDVESIALVSVDLRPR